MPQFDEKPQNLAYNSDILVSVALYKQPTYPVQYISKPAVSLPKIPMS